REPAEITQCFLRCARSLAPGDKAMDAKCIRPIGLESDCAKTFLRNQTTCQIGASRVKFMGAMGGFADKDTLRCSRQVDERIIIGRSINAMRGRANNCGIMIERAGSHRPITWFRSR